tara:strand:- start:9020 stop:9544 length:525 start_codon:yes stop_codon:yes gene_type:complete
MRVFFGLELAPSTSLQISDWRDRQLTCDGRPVPPANFHITLAFIGALDNAAMERLCLSVDGWQAQQRNQSATLQLDCTGYWHKQRVYWLGPQHWPESLTRLAQKLNTLGSAAGAKRDRNPFRPHITLFRGCSSAPPAPVQAPALSMHYAAFALFESRQGRQGVSYHVLEEWRLP